MVHKLGGVETATKYLEEEGGLADVINYASNAILSGGSDQQIQMNAELALALCCLASEGTALRMRVRIAQEYK